MNYKNLINKFDFKLIFTGIMDANLTKELVMCEHNQPTDAYISQALTLKLGNRILSLHQPLVMGILNITPDSFYADSRVQAEKQVCLRIDEMLQAGASIIDFGAVSTRPHTTLASEAEELNRLLSIIQQVRKQFPELIMSVDSFRFNVIQQVADLGVQIINDVSSGMGNQEIWDIIKSYNLTYILMHMQGNVYNMHTMTHYDNLQLDMLSSLQHRKYELNRYGIQEVIVDPGIGFSKSGLQNFSVIKNLKKLQTLGAPILVGISRKTLIWKTLNIPIEEALNGTSFLHAFCLLNGANILRVHDVKEAMECITLYNQICKA